MSPVCWAPTILYFPLMMKLVRQSDGSFSLPSVPHLRRDPVNAFSEIAFIISSVASPISYSDGLSMTPQCFRVIGFCEIVPDMVSWKLSYLPMSRAYSEASKQGVNWTGVCDYRKTIPEFFTALTAAGHNLGYIMTLNLSDNRMPVGRLVSGMKLIADPGILNVVRLLWSWSDNALGRYSRRVRCNGKDSDVDAHLMPPTLLRVA